MNRRLMGAAAVAGLAAVVAGCDDDKPVTAYCVDKSDRIVEDRNCGDKRDSSTGVFINNGQSYHYYYGGDGGPNGTRATGGTRVAPKDTEVVTRSGSTVQRGGLGAKSSGSGS